MHVNTSDAITLEEGLDLRKLQTTGSVLHINIDEHLLEADCNSELGTTDYKNVDFIGYKLENFATLAEKLTDIHPEGLVKKRVLEEGGGVPLKDPCTVFVAFSGYFDNTEEPFDVQSLRRPLEVYFNMTDEEDNGLIPGLEIGIKSMLVGELSIFLLSHKVAYGEQGMPPRIPPKAQCAFFIKLVKVVLAPPEGKLSFYERNMYARVEKDVKNCYCAGCLLYKSNNFTQAANTFRRAIAMLHRCHLADEAEEKKQERWLKKLYFNSALCYNKVNLPLKACTACNELNRLNKLWSNGRALFQNAKSLRMIGQYSAAEKRLKRAMALLPSSYHPDLRSEMELLCKTRESCNQTKLIGTRISDKHLASDEFKAEVDSLIKNFKENVNLCQLTLPSGLSTTELKYVKEVCIRENLFVRACAVPLETEENEKESKAAMEPTFAIDKEDNHSSSDGKSDGVQDGDADHEKFMKELGFV